MEISPCGKGNAGCRGRVIGGVRSDGKIKGVCAPCLEAVSRNNGTRTPEYVSVMNDNARKRETLQLSWLVERKEKLSAAEARKILKSLGQWSPLPQGTKVANEDDTPICVFAPFVDDQDQDVAPNPGGTREQTENRNYTNCIIRMINSLNDEPAETDRRGADVVWKTFAMEVKWKPSDFKNALKVFYDAAKASVAKGRTLTPVIVVPFTPTAFDLEVASRIPGLLVWQFDPEKLKEFRVPDHQEVP